MKKAILAAVLAVVTLPAFATNVCDGGTGGDKSVATASKFIANGFTQKCSANVYLSYEENTVVAAVGSASKKGKNIFSGSTAGGQVKATGTACASSGCVATDASGAATDAYTAASSS